MKIVPVKVRSYSGYRSDEYPRSFELEDKEYLIKEVTDRWYQVDNNPDHPPADYFKVAVACEPDMIIKHDLKNDSWYLCIHD